VPLDKIFKVFVGKKVRLPIRTVTGPRPLRTNPTSQGSAAKVTEP
jgi:hypothetical protein